MDIRQIAMKCDEIRRAATYENEPLLLTGARCCKRSQGNRYLLEIFHLLSAQCFSDLQLKHLAMCEKEQNFILLLVFWLFNVNDHADICK